MPGSALTSLTSVPRGSSTTGSPACLHPGQGRPPPGSRMSHPKIARRSRPAPRRSASADRAVGGDRSARVIDPGGLDAAGHDRSAGLGFAAARGCRGHAEQSVVEVRDLFERFIPEHERVKRLGDVVDRKAILALRGDRERGRLVFTANASAQCKSCHKAGDVGENVGPDLTKIGSKYNKLDLLDQILEPSRTIEPQYTTYLLETKDGRVLNGLAVERTKDRGGAQGRSGQDDQVPERGHRPACSAAAIADAGVIASRPDSAASGRFAGIPGVAALSWVELSYELRMIGLPESEDRG